MVQVLKGFRQQRSNQFYGYIHYTKELYTPCLCYRKPFVHGIRLNQLCNKLSYCVKVFSLFPLLPSQYSIHVPYGYGGCKSAVPGTFFTKTLIYKFIKFHKFTVLFFGEVLRHLNHRKIG